MSYIIEDNIDFYAILNNNNNDDDLNNEILDNENKCLISNTRLDENKITLLCGHSFNYKPLYKEIINQKTCFNKLEIAKLRDYQVKCPYCRNIQNKLIPYFNLKGVKRITGVNSPLSNTMCSNKCKYVFKSGKKKGFTCNSLCYFDYCNSHTCRKVLLANTIEDIINNNNLDYSLKTVKELRAIAKTMKISKYYKMKKHMLINTIITFKQVNEK